MLMTDYQFPQQMRYMRDIRNHTMSAVEEILDATDGVDIHTFYRSIAVAPYLIELHVDFETENRAFWFTFNQDSVLTVYRHSKTEYRREKFSIPFEELSADWLREVLLGK